MELPSVTKKPKGIPIKESALRVVEAAAIGQQLLVFEAAAGRGIDEAFDRRLVRRPRPSGCAAMYGGGPRGLCRGDVGVTGNVVPRCVGVNLTVAAAIVAAIGDISRFKSPRKLVSYFGLNPRVRQSGLDVAHHGRLSSADTNKATWRRLQQARRSSPRGRPCTTTIGGQSLTTALLRKGT
jgi:hypothetical protein